MGFWFENDIYETRDMHRVGTVHDHSHATER
jgi:hypothetical protein